MNYLGHYCSLMRKAEKRKMMDGYKEKHHIFPLSLYGKNNRIVTLTAREHYIAHALLEKICEKRYGFLHHKTIKMRQAHILMGGKRNDDNVYINSYLYEQAKIRLSEERKSLPGVNKGRKMSEEQKKKISAALKGRKQSEEEKEKRRGKKHSDESKKKMSESMKGKNKGKVRSEEHKQYLKEQSSKRKRIQGRFA